MINPVLLIITFILFFLVSWQSLQWGLTSIILLLPSYQVRFKIGFIPMTFLEGLILIVFLVWLIKLLKKDLQWQRKDFWWPIIFFVLTGIAATLSSADIKAGLGLWKAYILEPVLFFIVFINVIKEKREIKLILYSLSALSLFISIYALFQYFGFLYSPEPYLSEIPRRVTAVFPFPTAIGKLLGPIATLFLGLLIVKKRNFEESNFSKSERILFFIAFILTILSFVVSVNRGAIMAVGMAFIFLSFFTYYKKWIWVLIAIILVTFSLWPTTRNQIISIITRSDTSAVVHWVMWQGTWRLIQDRPIQGAGLGGFPQVYNLYRDPAHTELLPNPDNLYLTFWVEMGLAGLITFIWLIIQFFYRAHHLIKKGQNDYFIYPITLSLVASMITFLTHGLVDTPYFKNDLAIVFWLVIGLLAAITHPLQKSQNTL